MRRINFITILLCGVIVFMFSGCSGGILMENQQFDEFHKTNHLNTIDSGELFNKNTNELLEYFEIDSCGFNIKNIESGKTISIDYDIWENGKNLGNTYGPIVGEISSTKDKNIFISMQRMGLEENNEKLKFMYNSFTETSENSVSSNIIITVRAKASGRYTKKIEKAIDLTKDNEIPIWTYVFANDFRSSDSIEAAAQKADWAFVVKIKIIDAPEGDEIPINDAEEEVTVKLD